MCICQYFEHHIALVKQIDGKFGGSDKVATQRKGEPVIDSAYDHNELIFECLDLLLGHVPAVAVGRY